MANRETRVLKSNTIEQWRKLSNEVSLHLGDNDQLNNSLSDKTYNFVNPTSGINILSGLDNDSKTIRFELSPENTIDNTGGYIILVDSPSIPASFVSGVTLFQGSSGSPTYSGTIVSVSSEKILMKNGTGSFSSSATIKVAADEIASSNVVRIIAEAYPVGIVRVYRDSVEVAQSITDVNGFHIANHRGSVTLTGSPSVGKFTEGSTVYHGTTQTTQSGVESNATFWGTVLECTPTSLKLKTVTGTFSAGSIVRLLGSSDTIASGNHGAITLLDNTYGHTIELNSSASGSEDIQIFSMDIVAALNELQDDVGITENLTTAAASLVTAINEHDAELGTITSAAMGTTANTVSGAIAEHETQIGNVSITGISSGTNNITGALDQLHTEVGNVTASNLGTTASNLTSAVREHEDQIGNEVITDIDSGSDTITGALNQLHTEVGTLSLDTSGTDLTQAVNELEQDLFNAPGASKRTRSDLLTGSKVSIVDSINELHTELYTSGVSFSGLTANDFKSAVDELRIELGDHSSLDTNNTVSAVNAINELENVLRDDVSARSGYTINTGSHNIISAINELEADLFNVEGADKRTTASLLTSDKTSIVDSINEIHTELFVSGVTFTGLVANDFKAAVNEIRVDIGDVTASNLGTTASNLTSAVREHEDQIGNVSITSIDASTNTITGALVQLHDELGDITAINSNFTNDGNLVAALNELQTEVGANSYLSGGPADGINAANLTSAINAIDSSIGNTSYTGADLTTAIDNIQDDINTAGSLTSLNTTNKYIVGAINEHETDIGNVATLNDNAGYSATSISTGIVEIQDKVGSVSSGNMGTTASTLVTAIKEHDDHIGNMTFTGLSSTNISAALRELETEKLDLTSSSQQVITSRLQFKGNVQFVDNGTNADTMTFGTGTTLDLSNSSLLLPGNTSNINIFSVSFLEVDGNVPLQGFSVDRQHVTGISDTSDVRLQWDENYADGTSSTNPARAWQLQGLDDSEISHTTDIVTFYNAKELISSNTESGINVSWDSTNENFDFNVNDPTLTFTGDVAGSGTITNLANQSFALTIQPNSVALGNDTTGNYVADVNSGTNITVVGSDTEGAVKTVNLNDSITLAGSLGVNGNTTLGNGSSDTVVTTGDLTIGGNLIVNGTQTTLNVETLEVEDTLILTGSNLGSTEPTTGGFGFETLPFAGVHSTPASGITGAHSIVYNFATDRWEADGSLILSEATLGSPTIEGNTFGSSNNLDFVNGSGIGIVTAISGNDIDVTITNGDKGSSQAIFKNIIANSGGTATANINNDTLSLLGGTAITSVRSSDTVTFNHDNVGTAGTKGGAGSDGIVLANIVVNAQGHVTSGTSYDLDNIYMRSFQVEDGDGTEVTINQAKEWKFVEGAGSGATIDINWSDVTPGSNADPFDLTFAVTNTDKGSSQNIFKNVVPSSGTTAISDNNNDSLYLTGGSGIDTVGSGNDIITINHSDTSSVGNLSQNNSGHTFIQDMALTFDTFGHVTGATASSATLPTLDNYVSWNIKDGDTGQYSITSGDTLQIASGGAIVSNFTADDVLTISHADTSNVSNLNHSNSGLTFIQDLGLTFDGYGHVTGASASSVSFTLGNGQTSVTAGGGISLSGDTNWSANQTGTSTYSVSHADTSTQSSINNSSNTFIQDITLDTYGHITAIGSATVSIGNGQIDGRTSGLGLSGSMDASANQSGNTTFTVASNATVASTGSTIAYRDSSGDLHARIFRSEYDVTNASIGFIMTQVNTSSNNYMRPSTMSQVRSSLNVANGATNTTAPNNGTLTLSSGSGLSGSGTFTADQSGNTTVTYANTDKGSSQNIFKTIDPSSGTSAVAGNNSDTLSLVGGGGIEVTGSSGNSITIAHSNTSSQASVNNSGRTYIQDITLDTYGHITAISSATETVVNTNTNTTYTAGNGLDLVGTTFSLETDLRGNAAFIGHGTSDYMAFAQYTTDIRFAGNLRFRFESDGDFHADGDVVAYSTTTSSDIKLKKNIKKVENALDKVCNLDGVTFDWIEEKRGSSAGVIAQNVEEVLPSAVKSVQTLSSEDDTHKVVDYNQLSSLFIEAIKELKDENKELRTMIEELKSINS